MDGTMVGKAPGAGFEGLGVADICCEQIGAHECVESRLSIVSAQVQRLAKQVGG